MRNLALAIAASGIIRNAHYRTPTGKTIPERTLLTEAGDTNLALRSQEFNDAAWTKSGVTVTANDALAPDGTPTADRLTSAGAAAGEFVISAADLGYTANGEKCISLFLKGGTAAATGLSVWDATAATHRHLAGITWASGVPSLATLAGAGTRFTAVAMKDGWYRIAISGTGVLAANSNRVLLYPTGTGTAAGYLWAWGAMASNRKHPSSYIPTTSAAVARLADALYLPHTLAPEAGTLYVRFIELGMASYGSNEGVVSLGSSVNPSVMVLTGGGGGYYAVNRQAADQASGPPAGTPAIGDLVELRLVIAADGALTLGQSLNGGTETVGTASAAQALPAAWNAPRIYVGSRGAGTEGDYAFTHGPVFVAGTQTLDTMRQVAGVR